MRVALLAAALLAAAAGVSACGGSRHHGGAAPLISFAISDGTLPFGGCATINQPALIQPVGAASRGHCLFFDARGTLDHAGNAAVFNYTFSWVTTGGDIVLAQTTAELISLSSEAEHILPIGQPSMFRVDARVAGTGEHGAKTVLFTALNLAPIADPGEARVLPLHGYPWTNFPQVALRFDASKSRDPDGDPLVYCWLFSQAGIPVCGTDPHDPEFIATVNVTEEGRYFASATVTDGIDTSLPERAEVDVRTAGSWAVGAGVFAQVDPARSTLAVTGTAVALAVMRGSPEGLLVATESGGGPASLSIAPLPSAQPFSSSATSALVAPALFPDPANARVWALGAESQVIAEAYPVTVSSTPSIAAPTTAVLDPALDGTRSTPVAAVVGASLWVGVGDSLVKVDADGAIGLLRREPGLVFRAIAPRPGLDEVWVLVAPDPAGGPAPGQVALEVLDGSGAAHDLLQASELVDGLFFVGADELVARLSDGLVDLDPASLLATQTFDAARWRAPIGALNALVYDEGAGLFWGDGVDPATGVPMIWRVRRDGTWAGFEGGTLPSAIEPATGALWFGGTALTRTFTPQLVTGVGQTGTFPSASAPVTEARAAQDERTGGLWTIAQSPVTGLDELLHVSADGTRVSSITRVLVNGTNESLPNLVEMRVEPGGGAIWGFDRVPQGGPTTLRRYDLSTDPPTVATILDDSQLQPLSPYTPIVEPSSPISGLPIFAWIVRVSAAPYQVQQVALDGTISAAYPIPSNERDPVDPTRVDARAALLRAEETLCIATSQSNATLHVRRIKLDGTPDALGTIALDPTDYDPWSHFRVATSWAPGKSLCWAGARTGPQSFEIDAWDTAANAVHALVRSGASLVDMDPVTNDELRVIYDDAATGERRMEHVVFPAGSGPVVPWPAGWELVHQHQSH